MSYEGSLDAMVGLVPITVGAGAVLGITEQAMRIPDRVAEDRRYGGRRRHAGRRPRRAPGYERRGYGRLRHPSVGFGDFSNVGL